MQPETKVKENGAKAHTPTEQWDQLAFQVLYLELAPKGFKKVTGGSYKGQIIAVCDGPGLPKSKVTSAQKIAAQLIRGFRDKAKAQFSAEMVVSRQSIEGIEARIKTTQFWQFKKKAILNAELHAAKYGNEIVRNCLLTLDNVSIK